MNDSDPCVLGANREQAGMPLMQWQDLKHHLRQTREDCLRALTTSVRASLRSCSRRRVLDDPLRHDDDTHVQVVREASGLAEKALVGLRMFVRYGGALLYTDGGSPAPFGVLQNPLVKTSSPMPAAFGLDNGESRGRPPAFPS